MDTTDWSHSPPTSEGESNKETWCLKRVSKDTGWLRLFENTEVTIGRGLDVTHQLLSETCPLMISRLHCVFKQRRDGHWTVTDKKSQNGVWVNGLRLSAEEAQELKQGDSIELGVPTKTGRRVEYEYTLVRRPIKDIRPHLTKGPREPAHGPKRKSCADELEPCTSTKIKLYRCTTSDKPVAHPRSVDDGSPIPGPRTRDEAGPSVQTKGTLPPRGRLGDTGSEMIDLTGSPREEAGPTVRTKKTSPPPARLRDAGSHMIDLTIPPSQKLLALRERMDDTQREVADLECEGEEQPDDPSRDEKVRELQSELQALRKQVRQMEEQSVAKNQEETPIRKNQLEVPKTQLEDEMLAQQKVEEQNKVIAELSLDRKSLEKDLLAKDKELEAKDKELEVTKEENEKAKALKEEMVTHMTEVLETEMQCSICTELFSQAVTLNCSHTFCLHCIKEWRKRKNECPTCRQGIQSQTRSLVLDNYIDRIVDKLSPELKERRAAIILERRKVAEPDEVLVINDVDSSSNSSTENSRDTEDSEDINSYWGSSPYHTFDDEDSEY